MITTIGGVEAVESRLANGGLFWRLGGIGTLPERAMSPAIEVVRNYLEMFWGKEWTDHRPPECVRLKFSFTDDVFGVYRIGKVPIGIGIARAISPAVRCVFSGEVRDPVSSCEQQRLRDGQIEEMVRFGLIQMHDWRQDPEQPDRFGRDGVPRPKMGYLTPALSSDLCTISLRHEVTGVRKRPAPGYRRIHFGPGVQHLVVRGAAMKRFGSQSYALPRKALLLAGQGEQKLRIRTRDAERLAARFGPLLSQPYIPSMRLPFFADLNCVYVLYFSTAHGEVRPVGGMIMASEHFWVRQGTQTGYAPLLVG